MTKSIDCEVKAILLAAGLGTRLRPLTDNIPKCLLPIGGKPLLQFWFENLSASGVRDVLMNTHWLDKRVEDYVSNWESSNLKITTFHEPFLLGSAGTLMATKSWWAEASNLLILYADNFTTVQLSGVLQFHRSHELPFTLGIFETDEPRRCGIIELDRNDTVVDFMEKPKSPKTNLAAGGIYVADVALLKEVLCWDSVSNEPYDLGRHVLQRLIGRMKAYRLPGILLDIGTPDSYLEAQRLYAQGVTL